MILLLTVQIFKRTMMKENLQARRNYTTLVFLLPTISKMTLGFPAPVLSEKQVTYKEAHEQAVAEQQILDESAEGESHDIHQKLYDLATANWNTVAEAQAQYQGGSENFHEGPGGWNSGNGFSRVTG